MTDENKEPVVEQKKGAEEKTQLSEEALNNVSGGTPHETVKLDYGKIEWKYTQQKDA
jgi:bacteriocin-like protein